MSKSYQSYDGTVTFSYNEKEYEAEVHAKATYTHIPGRRYMSNGDPGYPDEDDFEIDDIEVETVFLDGEEVPYEDDMYDSIESALSDVDWDEDEPPEPDYDDWEERQIAKYEAMCDRYDAQ